VFLISYSPKTSRQSCGNREFLRSQITLNFHKKIMMFIRAKSLYLLSLIRYRMSAYFNTIIFYQFTSKTLIGQNFRNLGGTHQDPHIFGWNDTELFQYVSLFILKTFLISWLSDTYQNCCLKFTVIHQNHHSITNLQIIDFSLGRISQAPSPISGKLINVFFIT
jgi:hypothetical protein